MKKYFVETTNFTNWVAELPPEWDRDFAALQNRLMNDPEIGKVMKGCGGLRKVRLADSKRKKGKRGGIRVIYLHVPEVDCICMIHAYGKDEKDDLSSEERQVFAEYAERAKQKVLRASGRAETAEDEK
ncbi:MAG TPA: hypothetical protein VHR66_12080 [Gemmataceae bacterium]|jgi:hypothetical protein|nr:hypothetical protein [Gemmataceae bacterium]